MIAADDRYVDGQLLVACIAGENFTSEPGGLFEEPPAMVPAVTDPVGSIDTAVAQQKNGMILILRAVCQCT